ncbi:hypothetical protein NN561_006987 [Cricetulus griseus]
MLRAGGREGSAHLGRGRRRSWGHSCLSVSWLRSGAVERGQDPLTPLPRGPTPPALQPLQPKRRGGARLRRQLPQGQMKGPAASGPSLRPRPVRPQDGGRGREDSLLPTALGITASGASGSATSGQSL